MIAPTNRLIVWTGIVFIPFAALVAVVKPTVALIMSVLAGFFLLLVIIDAISAFSRLNGISIELPDIIRLSKGKKGEIPVRISNNGNKLKEIQIGFVFSPEILSAAVSMVVELSGDSELSSVTWQCRALRRGRSFLHLCYLRALSPLTFWTCRKKTPIRSEIRIYPGLFHERKDIAFLFQNRGIGIHSQHLMGKGRDFEQLREYIPGDSYEDIHWKATAKRQYPVTKVFQIERTQEVYVIIDASRMSKRIINNRAHHNNDDQEKLTIMERYISAALIMGLATERIGDLFGFLAFSNNIDRFMRAKRGKSHFNTCREALYTLQPVKASPDFSELITFISLKIRRRSLLIFMINLDDPVLADNFIEQVDILSRNHLVMVNTLDPHGVKPVFSSPDTRSTRDVYKNLGRHIMHQSFHNMEKRLEKRGIGFLLLDNNKIYVQLISQYLKIKQRQQL